MKLFTKRGCVIFFVIAIIYIILELAFDITETSLGFLVELTNSFRPKTGTIWSQNSKDVTANEQLEEYTQQKPAQEEIIQIDDLYQLKTLLDERESVVISFTQFLQIYTMLPPNSAQQIIPPFTLLRLIHDKQWTRTRISKGEQQLSFFFLDSDNQLLLDSYPMLGAIYDVTSSTRLKRSTLQGMPQFTGRTVTSEQFFTALLDLPANIQRQIISNPFELIAWQQNLSSVAISKFVTDDTVILGFEISNGFDSSVQMFESSQLAIGYLINKLNELYPDVNISMPRP
ncbi:hypothetical protein JW960_15010 [candidate division KSB1 bacterium]|nr:hypothetical protein [candidate division KSB1 bacterium]